MMAGTEEFEKGHQYSQLTTRATLFPYNNESRGADANNCKKKLWLNIYQHRTLQAFPHPDAATRGVTNEQGPQGIMDEKEKKLLRSTDFIAMAKKN